MSTSIFVSTKTIPLGRRKITRSGDRFYIILLSELNDLWRQLWEARAELNVLIEVANLRVLQHDTKVIKYEP
jgi:pyruvate/2-oxoglutarate/acetoin dehydrogenase E1 component